MEKKKKQVFQHVCAIIIEYRKWGRKGSGSNDSEIEIAIQEKKERTCFFELLWSRKLNNSDYNNN